MKVFITILALVAYTNAAGVSSYGSGVGLTGSSISLGSIGLGSGIDTNGRQRVQSVSVPQAIYSSGPIGLIGTPISLSGSSYGSGIGLNQGQTIRQVSSSQPILSTGNYGLSGVGQNQGQVVRRVAITQPSIIPISVQKTSINSGIRRLTIVQPVNIGRSLGNTNVPVQTISIAQQKPIPLNYGISRSMSNVQNVRPVSYSQPIASAQPIRSIQHNSLPIISAQPIRIVQVPRQQQVPTSQDNLNGGSLGSGLGIGQGQVVRSVKIAAQPVNSGISSSVSKPQNLRPASYSQPIAAAQPIRSVQQNSLPIISAQPIRTVQVARQPQVVKSQNNLSGASFGSGLGIGQGQTVRLISQPKLISVNSGGLSQPKGSAQPIRIVEVASQPIISNLKINQGGQTYGSGLGLNQGQQIRRVSVVQPLSTGNYGLTGSNYAGERSVTGSLPSLTSSGYGLGNIINKESRGWGNSFGK